MKKKIEVSIPNKVVYSIFFILGIVLLGAGVYAYNTNSPSVFGHTFGELGAPYGCSANTYLQYTPGGYYGSWTCSSIPTCTGSNQGLQWNGNAFVCKTYVATPPPGTSCSWTGWESGCGTPVSAPPYCAYTAADKPLSCTASLITDDYCSGGVITSTRNIYCCPNHGQAPCDPLKP